MPGDEIVIVDIDVTYVLSTDQKTNNRGAVEITTKSGNTIELPANAQIIILEDGIESGEFAFYVNSEYLYAASSSKNYLKTKSSKDVDGSWKITINDGVATVKAISSSNRNLLRFNPNNGTPLFSCYSSTSTTGTLVKIYKLESNSSGGGSTEPETPVCDHQNTETTITSTATCVEAGVEKVICECGVVISEKNVPATGHKFVDGECTVCKEKDPSYGGNEDEEPKWTLVTDASTLVAGDKIVIVCTSKNTVAGSMNSTYLTSQNGVSFSSDKKYIDVLPDSALIFTLGKSGSSWTLANNEGKLLGATAAKKAAFGQGTTTWTISIANSNATIKSTNTSYGWIQYNASSPRFLNYASSQTAIQIYVLK